MYRVFALGAALFLIGLVGGSGMTAAAEPQPAAHVMILGDSVATGMSWHPDAIAVVQRNLDVDWQIAICRRLTGQSCWSEGVQPPTAVDLVGSLTSVPPYVVMVMGYNDYASTFALSIDATMKALLAKGAQHVLWLTLRESEGPYPDLNQQLAGAVSRWPQLELVDWNGLSASHPEWFQTDGIHLVDAGGVAMARLVHGSVIEAVDPLQVDVPTLPVLRFGRDFRAQLSALGGTPPYRWRVASGRPPRGIHLTPGGELSGRPRGSRPLGFFVSVTDADGLSAVAAVRARF
jgi:hypothetical protein